jgi:prepilin-type N-terminal cleavage/methylation domain-containing protein
MTRYRANVVSPAKSQAGFTLVEMLVVSAVIAIMAGMAAPTILGAMRLFALNSTVQTVGAAIRSARYTAVSKNRTMRVRFNCPAVDQFRIVEVTGNAVIDNDANRCSEAAYPYPNPDPAAPNHDGPIVRLPVDSQFGALQSIQIDTMGRVAQLNGCPACAPGAVGATVDVVGNSGYATRTITVSGNGQVILP